jgi:acyl carrier protein phosphodiesterase
MDMKEGEDEMLTDEQIGDVGLNLLSEFVRVVLKRSYPPEVVEAMIDAARCAVGVPDLPTGDMDAFEVA